jgi:HAMP domain-containing protein
LLARILDEQRRGNIITAVAVALAVLVAAVGVLLLRRALGRPSRTLLRDVNTVAAGDYNHPVTRDGPVEFVVIADAVHRMRVSILGYGEQLADARQQLTRVDEQVRVGAELHNRTVRRLFALGLTLTSIASRFPDLAPHLRPLIDETDDMLRELRRVIVDLPQISRPTPTLRPDAPARTPPG